MPANRTAIVTGASKGIGRAIVQRLLADDYNIVGCARTQGAASEALAGLGDRAVGIDADVSRAKDVSRVVREALDRFGGVDVLVNNAGIYHRLDFLDLTEAQWNDTLAVNLTGAFLCSQAAARAMIDSGALERGGGRIVNIASTTGILSEQGSADYNASKAGMISLTRSLAVDLAEHGIVSSCVAPGWVDTGIDPVLERLGPDGFKRLNPLGRVGTPAEIAHVVAMLCDPRASFCNGSVIAVDGGQGAVSPKPI